MSELNWNKWKKNCVLVRNFLVQFLFKSNYTVNASKYFKLGSCSSSLLRYERDFSPPLKDLWERKTSKQFLVERVVTICFGISNPNIYFLMFRKVGCFKLFYSRRHFLNFFFGKYMEKMHLSWSHNGK